MRSALCVAIFSIAVLGCGHKPGRTAPRNPPPSSGPGHGTPGLTTPKVTWAECEMKGMYVRFDGSQCEPYPEAKVIPGYETASYLDGDFDKRDSDLESMLRSYLATHATDHTIEFRKFEWDNLPMLRFSTVRVDRRFSLTRGERTIHLGVSINVVVKDGKETEPSLSFDEYTSETSSSSLGFHKGKWAMTQHDQTLLADFPALGPLAASLWEVLNKPQSQQRTLGRPVTDVWANIRSRLTEKGYALDKCRSQFAKVLSFDPADARRGKLRIAEVSAEYFKPIAQADGSSYQPLYLGCASQECVSTTMFNYEFLGNTLTLSTDPEQVTSGHTRSYVSILTWSDGEPTIPAECASNEAPNP